jgi:hypothetical protein
MVTTDLSIGEVLTALGPDDPDDYYLAAYPMLNNVKPLRASVRLGDYVGHAFTSSDTAPYHHIDLRPTIKGGSRRPGAERTGKDEVSSEDEGPYLRQEAKADEPDADRVAAEWDAAMLAEKISATNAANRDWLDACSSRESPSRRKFLREQ